MNLNEEIVRLSCHGLTHFVIAEKLGVNPSLIKSRLYRLRVSGFCPPVHRARRGDENPEYWVAKFRSSPNSLAKNGGSMPKTSGSNRKVLMGTISLMISSIGPELMKKISEEVPEGSTLSEVMAAIIRDYYADEEGEG